MKKKPLYQKIKSKVIVTYQERDYDFSFHTGSVEDMKEMITFILIDTIIWNTFRDRPDINIDRLFRDELGNTLSEDELRELIKNFGTESRSNLNVKVLIGSYSGYYSFSSQIATCKLNDRKMTLFMLDDIKDALKNRGEIRRE